MQAQYGQLWCSVDLKIKDFPKVNSGRIAFALKLLLSSVNISSTPFNDA